MNHPDHVNPPPKLAPNTPCDFWCPICRRVVAPKGRADPGDPCGHNEELWHPSVCFAGREWIWSNKVGVLTSGGWVLRSELAAITATRVEFTFSNGSTRYVVGDDAEKFTSSVSDILQDRTEHSEFRSTDLKWSKGLVR